MPVERAMVETSAQGSLRPPGLPRVPGDDLLCIGEFAKAFATVIPITSA
jgi:hypothetical protein